MNPKESEIQAMILQWLNLKGLFCWRNNTGAVKIQNVNGTTRMFRAGMSGMPDILGISKKGRLFAIEVKRPKTGRLTDIQANTILKLREQGAVAFVATDLETVQEYLSKEEII